MAQRSGTPFERSVFFNCPFDRAYLPILHAVLFTIHDCGFIARTALEEVGANTSRLDKINRLIRESCYSVHDLSRVKITRASPLPRFNMPLECGLAMGAMLYLPKTSVPRDLLFLSAEPYEDKKTISDLDGLDGAYHRNQPELAIQAVRGFLAAKVRARGAQAILRRFRLFERQLPVIAQRAEISTREITSLKYVVEWLRFAAEWQSRTP